MEVDDENDENNSLTQTIDDDKNEAEQLISSTITHIFSERNYEALKNLLNCNSLIIIILSKSLIKYC